MTSAGSNDPEALKSRIRELGRSLGFAAVGFAAPDLKAEEAGLAAWLEAGYHGEMDYMARRGALRARPGELVPGTRTVISVFMDYLGVDPEKARRRTAEPGAAVISVYALGRDYHKVLRTRLQKLADAIAAEIGPFGHRVFTDSAPVMEVALAERAGLGWRGKHTLLINREAGSFFFLGEILTDLELPPDAPGDAHCGTCFACAEACPTGAIVGPYQLDARRCISYLTIELKGAIPEDLRPLIGNRIYGCDDCQLVCPWNKFARRAAEPDFARVRHALDAASLIDLFSWTEAQFEARMAGSAIRRIGYAKWLSNIAVALGNQPAIDETTRERVVTLLRCHGDHPALTVRDSVAWAIRRVSAPDSAPVAGPD
jgi:epoxyqueuosine reductase